MSITPLFTSHDGIRSSAWVSRFVMNRTAAILGATLLGLLLSTDAQSGERCAVRARASRERRLAPELDLLRHSDCRFLGVCRHGEAVFDVPSGQTKKSLQSMAIAVNADASQVDRKGARLLISYEGRGRKPLESTLQAAGLNVVEDYERGSFLLVEPNEAVSSQTVEALLADDTVLHAAPDYVMSALPVEQAAIAPVGISNSTPNDPLLDQLWGMQNIRALDVWPTYREAPNVVVAVIDTGVDYKHPDLKANMWSSNGKYGHDFFDDDDDPMDEQNHGTHCAGTIAGVGDNGVGVVGVSWKTRIMAMRFLGPDGSGATSDAVKCIDWAVANGAHILSNSWSGPDTSRELAEAITRAEQRGVLFVAAAGNTPGRHNNDTSPYYPAAHANANIITVAAIDKNDAAGSFTHFGPRSVDIGAPGVGIVSTTRNNQYAKYDGTSMACPHVAGAAALVWSKTFPAPAQDKLQMTTVRDLIYANARPIPALKSLWGSNAPAKVPGGVLDLSFLTDAAPVDPTPTPTPTPIPISQSPGRRTLVETRMKVDPSRLR